jgi:hypothetical protein
MKLENTLGPTDLVDRHSPCLFNVDVYVIIIDNEAYDSLFSLYIYL